MRRIHTNALSSEANKLLFYATADNISQVTGCIIEINVCEVPVSKQMNHKLFIKLDVELIKQPWVITTLSLQQLLLLEARKKRKKKQCYRIMQCSDNYDF